jgi:endonuclease III
MRRLPTSPLNTRQEQYRDDPWKMLMVCQMLNQTSHKQVDQVRHQFFERWPSADVLSKADPAEISEMIKILGFYNKRAKMWIEFSRQWMELTSGFENPADLPVEKIAKLKGIGQYAVDAWNIFQRFQYNFVPTDKVLKPFCEWARSQI